MPIISGFPAGGNAKFPEGGKTDQVLVKTEEGEAWGNVKTVAEKATQKPISFQVTGLEGEEFTIEFTEDGEGGSSGVESFNGRSGAIVPQAGDYTAEMVGAIPITRTVNGKPLSADITLVAADVGARSNTWIPTAANVGALPITGGTLTGNLRIKNSSNSGMKLNFGDSEYVYLHESSDDNLDIKAKTINFLCTNLRQNGSDIGGSGNVVVGTYAGSCSDGQTQSINLGFRPKIVIIYHGGELLPWYRSEFEDYDDTEYGDLHRDERIWHSDGAFIMDGFPIEAKNGNEVNNEDVTMVVGEITSSGFTVGQAYYNRNESTSRVDYYWKRYCDLATSGSTYAYIAFK